VSRIAVVGFAVAGVLAMLLATLPMALAPAMGLAPPAGLVANEAKGTVWRSVLRAARWNGEPLGDLRVGVQALPLLLGQARMNLSGEGWQIQAVRGARRGVARADGQLKLPVVFLPGARATLDARQARLVFAGGQCVQAGGEVRLALDSASVDFPKMVMSGTPACSGDQGTLVLTAAPGSGLDVGMTWQFNSAGTWSVQTRVTSEDRALRLALQLAGFHDTPAGLMHTRSGAIDH